MPFRSVFNLDRYKPVNLNLDSLIELLDLSSKQILIIDDSDLPTWSDSENPIC